MIFEGYNAGSQYIRKAAILKFSLRLNRFAVRTFILIDSGTEAFVEMLF